MKNTLKGLETDAALKSPARDVSCGKCLWPLALPWLYAVRVGEGYLARISNLYGLCEFGRRLGQLETQLYEANTLTNMLTAYLEAVHVLSHIVVGDVLELPNCKKHAKALIGLLDGVAKTEDGNYKWHEPLSASDVNTVKGELSRLLHSLSDELSQTQLYLPPQIRAYSMPVLIENAERLLDPNQLQVLPEDAVKDVKEAGKCLAFELYTAAGIHMMRAFEKVFRRFFKSSTGEEPGTIDIYKLIKDLRDNYPETDPKILNILDQIRNLHRNPLIHEVFLQLDDAVELLDIAKTAITAMTRQIQLTNSDRP